MLPAAPAVLKRVAALAVTLAILPFTAALVHAQPQERALWVTALDRSGAPVDTLSPDDIVVREDNVAREVTRIAPATEPMQIALMVDNSQASEGFIRDYREALPVFIQAMMGGDPGRRNEVALIALAERPTILANYTPESGAVLKGVQRLFATPQSGTYLLDGIIEISNGITKRGATRPVIVALVTEGPELSDRVYQQVLEALHESGAVLHIITLGNPRNVSHDRSMVLDRGTRETGGSYEVLLTGTALTNHLKKFANELTQQFRVTYGRPRTLIPPEKITVEAARDQLTVRGTPVLEQEDRSRR
jgi:hypothetical protein